MKISLHQSDLDGSEAQNFIKFRSKKQNLKGRQTHSQLVSGVVNEADPFSKFENPDLNALARQGYLDDLIAGIKSGKEASVFLGRNSNGLVAVKLYTDLRVRSFKHDEAYRAGRFVGDARLAKAIDQGSQKGQAAHQTLWVLEEFKQMEYLARSGVRVPKAIAVSGNVLIMEFIGEEPGRPAPRISDLKMDKEEAGRAFRQSVQNLKLMVRSGRVHGDYSTFNILWHAHTAVVIDFPQMMEIEHNPNAQTFLARDVHSLCTSFARQGIKADEHQVLREVLGRKGSAGRGPDRSLEG